MPLPRPQLAEELLRRLSASLRAGQLYSKGHPIISRNLDSLYRAVEAMHTLSPTLVVGIVDAEFIVDEVPVPRAESAWRNGSTVRRRTWRASVASMPMRCVPPRACGTPRKPKERRT